MGFLDLLKALAFVTTPNFPRLRRIGFQEDVLSDPGLTMGTLLIGRQGTGKTTFLAGHLLDYAIAHPTHPIFILDWSGALTDDFFRLALHLDELNTGDLIRRFIYDDLGNPEWVLPLPEFSQDYGGDYEEQVNRVVQNHTKLVPELVIDAPYIAGLSFREIDPEVCRLLTAISNEHGETWQITEAKKLLTEIELLREQCARFGHAVPEAKWFLENVYLRMDKRERELRSYPLIAVLGAIEPREMRARFGYYRPAWTPRDAVEKGSIVIVDGRRLINRKAAQDYAFNQVFSLILMQINKRVPHDPDDVPVSLVMDEVYSLLSIPGMASEIGKLSPIYRSRKLQPYVVIQALSQLDRQLRDQIWSIGNLVSFAISDLKEAEDIARQLIPYESRSIKVEPRTPTQQPIFEADRGQYLEIANWLQRLAFRECIARRYLSERELDPQVRHIPRTQEWRTDVSEVKLEELKDFLLRRHGVRVREALDVVNQRSSRGRSGPPQVG